MTKEKKVEEVAVVEEKPHSIMDMIREQDLINKQINYQAAKVKGQTFVKSK